MSLSLPILENNNNEILREMMEILENEIEVKKQRYYSSQNGLKPRFDGQQQRKIATELYLLVIMSNLFMESMRGRYEDVYLHVATNTFLGGSAGLLPCSRA